MLLLICALSAAAAGGAAEPPVPKYRDGLPGFFARLEAGNPVAAVWLGESGAADAADVWLKRTAPEAGYTVSEKDPLTEPPGDALVFIEILFENGRPPSRAPERIGTFLRRLWISDPAADVVLVYVDKTSGALAPAPAAPFEFLADRCGIVSLSVRAETDLFAALEELDRRNRDGILPSLTEVKNARNAFAREEGEAEP